MTEKYKNHSIEIKRNVNNCFFFLEIFFNTLLVIRSYPDVLPIGSFLILTIFKREMGLVGIVIGKIDGRNFLTSFV